MRRFLISTLVATLIILGFGFTIFTPSYAAIGDSPSANKACQGANVLTGGGGCSVSAGKKFSDLLTKIVNLLSWIVGVVAVIMVIFGGFSIITANGDPQKVSRGRISIISAIVGLVIVALSQIIARFVASQFK